MRDPCADARRVVVAWALAASVCLIGHAACSFHHWRRGSKVFLLDARAAGLTVFALHGPGCVTPWWTAGDRSGRWTEHEHPGVARRARVVRHEHRGGDARDPVGRVGYEPVMTLRAFFSDARWSAASPAQKPPAT